MLHDVPLEDLLPGVKTIDEAWELCKDLHRGKNLKRAEGIAIHFEMLADVEKRASCAALPSKRRRSLPRTCKGQVRINVSQSPKRKVSINTSHTLKRHITTPTSRPHSHYTTVTRSLKTIIYHGPNGEHNAPSIHLVCEKGESVQNDVFVINIVECLTSP